jgi:two-component system nitrogen regulation response regulator NtrX
VDVLIVDDEGNIRRMLRALLESEGYRVQEAPDAETALARVDESAPEVVLLDLALPGRSGLDILPDLTDAAPGTPVVMMSGQATLSDAVEATRRGAFHFLEKPLGPEAVLVTLGAALEVGRARDLSRALHAELGPGTELVGESPAMQRVRETIRKVAPTQARVLISGESGTGKELAAAAIHGLSSRRGGPFVRVNSAAIPPELVESEMFGHEKGAFTGAEGRRRGRFEMADGGTLFLDEVADLGPRAQAKLLRALETGEIERLGGSGPIPVDVRVLAATHRDLRAEAEAGRFREDLLFRLEVVPLAMPPLRDRPEDVRPLLEHAAERLQRREGLTPPTFRPGALARLESHTWPGNVRELNNTVERLAILGPPGPVGVEELEVVLRGSQPAKERGRSTPSGTVGRPGISHPVHGPGEGASLSDCLEEYERALIAEALEASGGNVAEAGRRLRTDRANLYRRMKRLGLRQ